jgi:hypothetical protein
MESMEIRQLIARRRYEAKAEGYDRLFDAWLIGVLRLRGMDLWEFMPDRCVEAEVAAERRAR